MPCHALATPCAQLAGLPALLVSSTAKTEIQALHGVVFGADTCAPPQTSKDETKTFKQSSFWVDTHVLANCSYPVCALQCHNTQDQNKGCYSNTIFSNNSNSMYNKLYSVQKQSVLTYKISDSLHTHPNHRLSTDKNKAISPSSTLLQTTFYKAVPFPTSGSKSTV
jgi:hypothetical protein